MQQQQQLPGAGDSAGRGEDAGNKLVADSDLLLKHIGTSEAEELEGGGGEGRGEWVELVRREGGEPGLQAATD